MEKDQLIQRLMETFLGELEGHVEALNRDLLELERADDPGKRADLLKALFRTIHSAKGAAGSVNVIPVRDACHRLEDILAPLRDRNTPPSTEMIQLFLTSADALADAVKRLRDNRGLEGSPFSDLLSTLDTWGKESGKAATDTSRPATAVSRLPAASEPGRSEPAAGDQGWVRVSAAKLDDLLSRSSELFAARHRGDSRAAEVRDIQDLLKTWQAEWSGGERALRALLAKNGNGGGNEGRRQAFARQAVHALALGKDSLKRISQEMERLASALAADHHVLSQSATRLDEEVRGVRMVPFRHACGHLDRAVRDTSRGSGKNVELSIKGGEVELDRTIIEGLKDPLLHLVRNAVDHGIETPAEREAAGKPALGEIVVQTSLGGDGVEVVVQDNGRGLDFDAIRDTARRRNIPLPGDDRDVSRLVFLPGFSTAPRVTELSGRGVGLDVVKAQVESLHGTVGLTSLRGGGTRVVLSVPLTLTTLRVLLASVGGNVYAFRTADVARLARAAPEEVRTVEGRDVLLLGDRPVPMAALGELLGVREAGGAGSAGKLPVVVLSAGGRTVGLVVDEFHAEQEVLVKNLGARLRRVKNVNGGTVLGDGRVALILNGAELIETALGHVSNRRVTPALGGAAERKKRLLVVDDSVTTRSMEKSILQAAGYEVSVGVDGAQGWQLVQETEPDLVVSDIEMPRMDGFMLLENIRRSRRFKDLPVILVTGLKNEKDMARGLEAGANAYLLKSEFDQTQLLAAIGQLI